MGYLTNEFVMLRLTRKSMVNFDSVKNEIIAQRVSKRVNQDIRNGEVCDANQLNRFTLEADYLFNPVEYDARHRPTRDRVLRLRMQLEPRKTAIKLYRVKNADRSGWSEPLAVVEQLWHPMFTSKAFGDAPLRNNRDDQFAMFDNVFYFEGMAEFFEDVLADMQVMSEEAYFDETE